MHIILLRQAEFARQLGVSENTVKRWLLREESEPGTGVRFIRLPGGERRIPWSEVERILGKDLAS
jgi:predicted site-specific integrase-resolvase